MNSCALSNVSPSNHLFINSKCVSTAHWLFLGRLVSSFYQGLRAWCIRIGFIERRRGQHECLGCDQRSLGPHKLPWLVQFVSPWSQVARKIIINNHKYTVHRHRPSKPRFDSKEEEGQEGDEEDEEEEETSEKSEWIPKVKKRHLSMFICCFIL